MRSVSRVLSRKGAQLCRHHHRQNRLTAAAAATATTATTSTTATTTTTTTTTTRLPVPAAAATTRLPAAAKASAFSATVRSLSSAAAAAAAAVPSTSTTAEVGHVLAFTGQGSQFVGMGKDLHSTFSCAREVFEEVDDALQRNLSRLMFTGAESDLRATANSQPAILAHSAAVLAVLRKEFDLGEDLDPTKDNNNNNNNKQQKNKATRAVMGHSLGEFTAAYAAGSFSLADSVRLVRLRGELMQQCAPSDGGRMVALFPVRGGANALADVCHRSRVATGQVCEIANINTSTQIVLSGHSRAVDLAAQDARDNGLARRATPLSTSAPFHCSLMQPAAQSLLEYLNMMASNDMIHDPCVGIIANATADLIETAAELPNNFFVQATSPVLWQPSMLRAKGLLHDKDSVVCIGPSATLAAFFKSEGMSDNCVSVHNVESVRAFGEHLSASRSR